MVADVGGIADGMHLPVGVAGGDQLDHAPGVGELAGAARMP
jgi:hypothetical protein